MYYNGNIFRKDVSKACEWLSKSSEKGNPSAQQLLGRFYIQGEGVEKNEKKGFNWLKKAAENGSPAAQYNLGSCYYNGTGTQKNNGEAFKWIRKAAEQKIAKNYFKEGTSKLYFILGQLYERGEGCEANQEEAVKWYARAASQGDVEAGKAVERLKTGGAPGTALKSYSVELLQKAEAGDANAQYLLGQCYFLGLGTSKNDKMAFQWTTKSAEQGNAQAEYNLGASYLQGIGTVKNEREAFKWYKRSADKGVPLAQYNLGVLYQKGIGVEKNDAEALTWFTKSADQGNADAKKAVSCIKGENDARLILKETKSKNIVISKDSSIVMFGKLDSPNKIEPFSEDLKKKAEAGDERAQYALGMSYFYGIGVAKNETEAKKWLSKAGQKTKNEMFSLLNYQEEEYSADLVKRAENGDPASQCSLGMCLLRASPGIKSIREEAIQLIEKSSAKNDSNAQYFLSQLYLYGVFGVEKNMKKGIDLCRKSAEQGNPAGQLALGSIYLGGIGVEKNHKEAVKWIEASAKQGYQPAHTLYEMVKKVNFNNPQSATNPQQNP